MGTVADGDREGGPGDATEPAQVRQDRGHGHADLPARARRALQPQGALRLLDDLRESAIRDPSESSSFALPNGPPPGAAGFCSSCPGPVSRPLHLRFGSHTPKAGITQI